MQCSMEAARNKRAEMGAGLDFINDAPKKEK